MGKIVSKFICNECGYESMKWLGKCPACEAWNTLIEERGEKKTARMNKKRVELVPLTSISSHDISRFSSGIGELDRVLGGGIVPGSIILLGGDPGIGKSTLLLQVADHIGTRGGKVIYLSGEESLKQIRLRSLRLDISNENIYLLNEQEIELLEEYIRDIDPSLIIIDSIQTVYSGGISSIPGSVAQLRECTARITEIAKKTEKAFFLIGHVTKEGAIAGPRVLEHMVDVVIYFEGENNFCFRLLRGIKNRFGSTNEIGLMEMRSEGLWEVLDPSEMLLGSGNAVGTAITSSFEGSRPFLIEAQALASPSGPGYPRRMAAGIDQNRLSLIIAVLEKVQGYNLSVHDVYLRITGGLFIKDPAADLGIAAAIISSVRDTMLPADTIFVGELGLSGQVRSAAFLEARLKEALKLGYKRAAVPAGVSSWTDKELKVYPLASLDNLIDFINKE
jgi:DNA repair protein RadA/Sms